MATRRTGTGEKASLTQDMASSSGAKSDTSPAVPASVIIKLVIFTIAMFTLPVSSFFLTRDRLFGGNTAYAGGFAAFVANTVLIVYIVVAFLDDKGDREAAEAEQKKQR